MQKTLLKLTIISLLFVASFAQIAAQDDDMMMDVNLFATLNPADLENDAIINLSADLMAMNPVFADFADPVTSIQSLDFTSDGTAYVTFDAADGTGGITALSGLTGMMDDDMMVDMMSPIMGANTGIMAPKGIEVIESLGVVLVANFGAGNILAFPMDASGDVEPAQTIVGGTVWDILYVEETDTLYAAGTSGDILAYDDFSTVMGEAGPTRVIQPSNGDLEKVTINLHGLVYVADQDTLLVSDVGAADDATDGHLYAVPGISTVNGNVTVSLHILGTESMLGNPVDLAWDGSGLYVAEKANDVILYFGNLLDMGGMMDTTPTSVLDATKPESLAIYEADMMMDDGEMGDDSMMGDDMMMDISVFATLNPADLENDAIINLSADLMAMNPVFADFADPVTSIQSIDFTSDGTAYVTFDAADGTGGITALSGLTGMMEDEMMVDMMAPIMGANTGLTSPKGIEIIESLGVILVANFGEGNIKAFSMDDSGDVLPAQVIGLGDVEGSVWDILYVEETDTLYAAGTAGDILAYDDFSNAMGDMGPSRVIAPSNGDLEKVTINLHALVYVADQDTLIVSDVGAADDATDGHIYAVADASTADGNTTVSLHILGPDSMLGNPVDLVWDGSGLYVAEKANDAILYFGNLLDMGGMMDTTPTSVIEVSKPESLAIYAGDM
ncbi:MAG: hypothetical protein Phog2KO_23210 [Phototrophicaceae bacterium]